jgi:hypothetical protein
MSQNSDFFEDSDRIQHSKISRKTIFLDLYEKNSKKYSENKKIRFLAKS